MDPLIPPASRWNRTSPHWAAASFAILLILSPVLPALPEPDAGSDDDLSAARRLFQANLDAIRRKDRDAYLACYLNAGTLARTGPEGSQLGFESLAKETGAGWPDLFEGLDLELVPVRPGLVYGTYRYRVRYGASEQSGISERLFLKMDRGWRIAVTGAFPSPPGTPPPPRALVGATLVDGTGVPPVPDSVVVLRGGKIDCAGSRAKCPVPAGIEVMDLAGSWITPGLIDAHVHFSQTGWADGRPDFIDVRQIYPYEDVLSGLQAHPERFFRSYLCSGVTAVFDVGGYPWTWGLREKSASDPLAPHVAATGPLLSTRDFWLNLPGEKQFLYLGTGEDARSGVRYLKAHGTDAVKVWFIPVTERKFEEMESLVLAAGEEARRLKVPLIMHATGLREAKAALRAGASLLVHGVDDAPVDDEFLRLAREGHAVYCPTLTVMDGYRRLQEAAAAGKAPGVDDPGACVDPETLARVAQTANLGTREVDPKIAERRKARYDAFAKNAPANLRRVLDAGIPVAMGTDAGNPLTLHGPSVYAEMEAMQSAGLSPMEVIVASTRGGALAMGRPQDLGTAQAGKVADLLVLGADPTRDVKSFRQIRHVIRGGVVRKAGELRASPSPSP
jgi:imidazolonepropionase-like amidohydrolase